jgi:hypothetical protein
VPVILGNARGIIETEETIRIIELDKNKNCGEKILWEANLVSRIILTGFEVI